MGDIMRTRLLVIVGALVASGLGLVPASAAADEGTVVRPVRQCAELVRDFELPGASTHVTSATVVPAGEEPAHCDVRGVVEPAIQFQLRLPTDTYRGRYLQFGCGGFCGYLVPGLFPDCGPGPGDLAVATTDDGHVTENEPPYGRWAANDQAARDDYTFRAPHVVSRAAKRIIATFYGTAPQRSYFSGCSNGGREALLLAQRYPTDFDGIIAAAPAAHFAPLMLFQAWLVRSNTAPDGSPVLTPEKLPALHDAVLAACDGLDGLVDGQLADTRVCRFDPATLRCPGADVPDCLTPAQVSAVREVYAGPTDERGRRLYPGGEPYGSELAWAGWFVPTPDGADTLAFQLAEGYLRFMGYPIGTPHSSVADFRFTASEFHRLAAEGRKVNALDLDLRPFRRAGGKLILWQGNADQAIPPAGTLDYYQRLTERGGGPARTRQWARMFEVPSLYHCAGGGGLTEFDPIRELVDWVELGTAPDRLVATGRDEAGAVTRTRPVFPYPQRARYDGTGSIDDEANFVPAPPQSPPHDKLHWLGEYLHALPGPVAE